MMLSNRRAGFVPQNPVEVPRRRLPAIRSSKRGSRLASLDFGKMVRNRGKRSSRKAHWLAI